MKNVQGYIFVVINFNLLVVPNPVATHIFFCRSSDASSVPGRHAGLTGA